jgi:phycobilisome core-membrane linker protein
VARSNAFRRRYWSSLYITKAIEVMHRRLLGRPTFGRWEINAYFDTAARKGFYGVVDAMLESREYNDCFGEDTVPYERFITPADRNARRVPGLVQTLETVADLTPLQRPIVPVAQVLRTVGDLVPRNLTDRPKVRGQWSADVAGGQTASVSSGVPTGPQTVKQPPAPTRSWSQSRWQPGGGSAPVWRSGVSTAGGGNGYVAPASIGIAGNWKAMVGTSLLRGAAVAPDGAMAKALRPGSPQGFNRRQSLARPVQLLRDPSETQVQEVVQAVYRQLLNRVPFAAERQMDPESQLRDGQLSVAEFVSQIAGSDLFQQRLQRMAPLRAASAAYLALLGRAAMPAEVSRFLATRATAGQQAAVAELLNAREYASAFGQDTVPYLRGLATEDGVPLTTVNRTASLYGGNGGLTPSVRGAI